MPKGVRKERPLHEDFVGDFKFADKNVGARLRELRQRIGLSQTDLADRMGISFQQVQKFEKGANRMGVSRLMQACVALGVSPNTLLMPVVDASGMPVLEEGGDSASERPLSFFGARLARRFDAIEDDEMRRVAYHTFKSFLEGMRNALSEEGEMTDE